MYPPYPTQPNESQFNPYQKPHDATRREGQTEQNENENKPREEKITKRTAANEVYMRLAKLRQTLYIGVAAGTIPILIGGFHFYAGGIVGVAASAYLFFETRKIENEINSLKQKYGL